MIFPFKISNDFEISVHADNRAVDVFLPEGTEVRAPINGRVHYQYFQKGGQTASLIGSDSREYYFAHLQFTKKASNEKVRSGEIIGVIGRTGSAIDTEPHCHVAISALDSSVGADGLGSSETFDILMEANAQSYAFLDDASLSEKATQAILDCLNLVKIVALVALIPATSLSSLFEALVAVLLFYELLLLWRRPATVLDWVSHLHFYHMSILHFLVPLLAYAISLSVHAALCVMIGLSLGQSITQKLFYIEAFYSGFQYATLSGAALITILAFEAHASFSVVVLLVLCGVILRWPKTDNHQIFDDNLREEVYFRTRNYTDYFAQQLTQDPRINAVALAILFANDIQRPQLIRRLGSVTRLAKRHGIAQRISEPSLSERKSVELLIAELQKEKRSTLRNHPLSLVRKYSLRNDTYGYGAFAYTSIVERTGLPR